MINQTEVNKMRVINPTDSNNEPLHTFKIKTKPRNFDRSARAIRRYKQRRSAEIKIGVNLVILLAVAAFIMIKTGLI